ncbi:hypothetical protein AMTRI_Chr04g189530 [Amborella trichopoda]|uniref:Major facilitator superfamily (MFS) profile domain-containing protein n=1 Tax=Amborella trichopoda TaxID=13333 RepID=W1NFT4_AMBTC|nr:polyol transporter 5 [Amborella trichopoda]XP_020519225.1 polyol transporter 5 [Amborella trichopoda]ERM94341.1 hypothetical protein AMTR_s00010p00243760 [Amborella trichopoda]|eukprot:XP_020519221.1 polyol transporter 5 [Amborella trichopoda]
MGAKGISRENVDLDHEQPDRIKKPKRNKYALACAFLASMASVLLGYDTGVMSGAAMFIKDDLNINDIQVEILVGSINIYALIGSAFAGWTSDWIGRRKTIAFAGAIFFVGSVIMGFAPNYALLTAGRVVAGIGVGYALMIAPVYTTEVAPTSIRGFLTSFPEIFINGGVLLGYVSNFAFADLSLQLSWRMMLGVGVVPSVFLIVGGLVMPESPRWLIMQGKLGAAMKVLLKTSDSPDEAQLRLSEIKLSAGIPNDTDGEIVSVPKRHDGEGVWKELILHPTPAIRRILIVAIGMHFFQQASGIDAVVLYSPRVFRQAGIKKKNHLLGATIAVGASKTFSVLIATFLLDRMGRRPLLFISLGGMIISVCGLGFGLTMIAHTDEKLEWAITLCIVTILLYVAFFEVGLGPIAWVYTSEIFPLRLRATGVSIGVAVNRLMSGVNGMTFISLYKAITVGGAFFLFAGICFLAFLFIFFFLPETNGRTLEEVSDLFAKKTTTLLLSQHAAAGEANRPVEPANGNSR